MSLRRLIFLGAVAPMALWFACTDVFRPVFVPIPNNPPDPKLQAHVVVVATNGPADFGSTSLLDVSGDSNVGNTVIGKGPVFAALEPNGRFLVANQAEDTVSEYLATSLLSSSAPGLPNTIVLPAGSKPSFLTSTQSGAMYVLNSGTRLVGQISDSNVLLRQLPTGNGPVALTQTPDGSKLYVVNQTDSTITSINTVDCSYSPLSPIAVGKSPLWAVASSDSKTLFVANQGGDSVTVIDTFTDTVRGTLTLDAGAQPNYLVYDSKRTRLYVCEPGTGKVSVWDATQSPALPVLLATVTVDANPIALSVLPDGSKFYAVSYSASGGSVSVSARSVDSVTFQVSPSIALGAAVPQLATSAVRFPIYSVPSSDSSRVFVSLYDAGGTATIRTSDDTYQVTIPGPPSTQAGVPPPPQNPVFLVTAQI